MPDPRRLSRSPFRDLAITVLAPALFGCQSVSPYAPEQEERFEEALAEMQESQGAVGGGLIVGDASHRYAGAIGLADREATIPMTVETPFRSASVAKTFTGALILSLHEEGSLSVDDPLSRYVDTVPNAESITLRMLLTHTSGLANYTRTSGYQALAATDAPITAEQLVALAVEQGPDFAPGTAWNYCNTGYILLGMIAEGIVGRPLAEELDARFFTPLGMHGTYPRPSGTQPDGLARGYVLEAGELVESTSGFALRSYVADGGCITTLDDMLIWSRAFFGGELHSAQTLALARHPEGGELLDDVARAFDLDAGGYALGFIQAEDPAMGALFAGAGNGDGIRTFVGFLPEHDLAFALFVNVGDSQVPIVQTLSAARPVLAALREHIAAP